MAHRSRILRGVLCFALCSLTVASTVHATTIDWSSRFGGQEVDHSYDIEPLSDGGLVAVGMTSEGGLERLLAVKTDEEGALVWTRSVDVSAYTERAHDVFELENGDLLVTGAARVSEDEVYRPFLLLMNAAGEPIWTTEDGITSELPVNSEIVRAARLTGGNVALAGGARPDQAQEPWVAILSTSGVLLHFRTFPSGLPITGEQTIVNAVAATEDGGFVVAGTVLPQMDRAYLWKFDETGASLWSRGYGGVSLRSAFDVCTVATGGFVLTGSYASEHPASDRTIVVKTGPTGLPDWVREFYAPSRSAGYAVVELTGGHLLVAQTEEMGGSAYTSRLLELEAGGGLFRSIIVRLGSFSTFISRLDALDDYKFVGTGTVRDEPSVSTSDMLVFGGTVDTEQLPTSIDPTLATERSLRVSPNPTTGALFLAAPSEPYLELLLLDATGRVLRNYSDQVRGSDLEQTVALDGLSPGLYFLRARFESASVTQKVLLRP